ncbi:MAG: PAS domain S-box protein [Limisphaerales bacterium]
MNKTISILLITDDLVDEKAILALPEKGSLPCEFEVIRTVAAARSRIPSGTHDLIIAGLKLADGTAFDFLDLIGDKAVIIIAGSGDEEAAARALEMGACDCLVKDPERNYLKLLPHRVEAALKQRESERRLRESEQRYCDVIENTADLVQSVSPEGNILFTNRAWRETLGYTEAEVPGLNLFQIIAPDDLEHCRAIFQRLMRGEQLGEVEVAFRARDGRRIELEGNLSARIEQEGFVSARCIFRDVTARKTTLAALRESETRLDLALKSSEMGVWSLDIATGRRQIDEQGCRLLGIDPSRYARSSEEFFNAIHPDDRAAVKEALSRTQAENVPYGPEYRVIWPDGTIHHITARGRLALDESGWARSIHGILWDITSRKGSEVALQRANEDLVQSQKAQLNLLEDLQAEIASRKEKEVALLASEQEFKQLNARLEELVVERTRALSASEDRFRAVAEHLADGLVITDLDDIILDVNPRLLVMTGFTRAELVGHAARSVLNTPDQGDIIRTFSTPRAESEGRHYESEFRRKDATVFWADINGAPVPDANGNIFGTVSVIRDISLRKEAEAALRASEQRFQHLIESMPEPVLLANRKGEITYVNRQLERLLDYRREDLVGQPVELLVPDAHRAHHPKHRDHYHGDPSVRPMGRTMDLSARRRDGVSVPVEIALSTIESPEGPLVIASMHDITLRKNAERQMLRSQRMEAIGTLAGGIAHDLNNSLAPVLMGIEELKSQYPDESELLDTIESSAKRGAEMVKQLLTFAKGREGEQVRVFPDALMREMERIIRSTFPKNISLRKHLGPGVHAIKGDPTQLHQVLLNLCVNARDSMPNGGLLTLKMENRELDASFVTSGKAPEAQPGTYVMMSVTDTGTGIPPEVIDRIFDPFFTTKSPDKGTGLGLSTVIGIVRGHGGFVLVSSQLGHGSHFAAFLPADTTVGDTEIARRDAETFRGQGETVLYVDDEAPVRKVATAVLQRLNLEVLLATDGADALVQVAQNREKVRVIITDVNMPHMDGLALVHAMQRMAPEIPVIVSGGRVDEALVEQFKSLGVVKVVDKPFTQEQLAAALSLALRRPNSNTSRP